MDNDEEDVSRDAEESEISNKTFKFSIPRYPKYISLLENFSQGKIYSTLTVFKFAQYYFSRTSRCANLSTARIIVRANRSNFPNFEIL